MIEDKDLYFYNFKRRYYNNIKWEIAELTPFDFQQLQDFHDKLSKSILVKIKNDKSLKLTQEEELALFNKRCPSFVELINLDLEKKACQDIRMTARRTKEKQNAMPCPKCRELMFEGYRDGYQYWCGKCHKYKVRWPKGHPKYVEGG